MTLETAARELSKFLTPHPGPGMVMVGVGTDTIHAYCQTKRDLRRIPASWKGFPVRATYTGRIKPA